MPKDGELLVLQVYQLSNIYFFITIHVKKLYFLGGGGGAQVFQTIFQGAKLIAPWKNVVYAEWLKYVPY